MVTESFVLMRSGEKIAYFAVYRNGTDGVNLMYDDELITYRTIDDVDIKELIETHNLKYKSLKLAVNQNVSGIINTNIKKELLNKEINIIVEEDRITVKGDKLKSDDGRWFRDVYFHYLNEYAIENYKEWEDERINRYGY